MSSAATDFNHIASKLFNEKLITAPLTIRAQLGRDAINAQLLSNGVVELQGQKFADIHQAMIQVLNNQHSSCSAWQYWNYYSEKYQSWNPLEHLRARLQSLGSTEIRTSVSHPLRIDEITVTPYAGVLGLTFCPGKKIFGLYSGQWQRDLELDLQAIKAWGATTIISLMQEHEFAKLQVPDFGEKVAQAGFLWVHAPIRDMQVPDEQFERVWQAHEIDLFNRLQRGERLLIHCRGGLGRTGLLAARILVDFGEEPESAILQVRRAREHTIETYLQEAYILNHEWTKVTQPTNVKGF